jgi:hypothetical protein
MRKVYRVYAGNLKGRNGVVEIDKVRRAILISVLEREDIRVWAGFIWLRLWTNTSCCEYGNEPPVSIKCGVFSSQLSLYLFHGDGKLECSFVA